MSEVVANDSPPEALKGSEKSPIAEAREAPTEEVVQEAQREFKDDDAVGLGLRLARIRKNSEERGVRLRTIFEAPPVSEELQAQRDSASLLEQEARVLGDKTWGLQAESRGGEERLGEIGARSFLGRLIRLPQRVILERKRVSLGRQIEEVKSSHEGRLEALKQLEKSIKELEDQGERALLNEVRTEMQGLRKEYESFAQELESNTAAITEINQAYFRNYLEPMLDQAIAEGGISSKDKEVFEATLRKTLLGDEEAAKKLDAMHFGGPGLWEFEDTFKPLVKGGSRQILARVVSHFAATDLLVIEDELKNTGRVDDAKVHALTREVAKPPIRFENEQMIESSEFRVINPAAFAGVGANMDFWACLRESPLTQTVFGLEIKRIDEDIYQSSLKGSLTDSEGGYIDTLYYYPTPESIRNLVLLAAADAKSYRTVHANWVLSRLARRRDRAQTFDRARSYYPEMTYARELLDNWTYREYGNQPDIQLAAQHLAFRIYEDPNMDPTLRNLALEALPNSILLDMLSERGVVSEGDSQTLKEAEGLLRELSKRLRTTRQEEGPSTTPYIEGYSLRQTLRSNLFNLINGPSENSIRIVRKLTTLSKLVLENREDYEALVFLTTPSLIDALDKSYRVLKTEHAYQFNKILQDIANPEGASHFILPRIIADSLDISQDAYQKLQLLYSSKEVQKSVMARVLLADGLLLLGSSPAGREILEGALSAYTGAKRDPGRVRRIFSLVTTLEALTEGVDFRPKPTLQEMIDDLNGKVIEAVTRKLNIPDEERSFVERNLDYLLSSGILEIGPTLLAKYAENKEYAGVEQTTRELIRHVVLGDFKDWRNSLETSKAQLSILDPAAREAWLSPVPEVRVALRAQAEVEKVVSAVDAIKRIAQEARAHVAEVRDFAFSTERIQVLKSQQEALIQQIKQAGDHEKRRELGMQKREIDAELTVVEGVSEIENLQVSDLDQGRVLEFVSRLQSALNTLGLEQPKQDLDQIEKVFTTQEELATVQEFRAYDTDDPTALLKAGTEPRETCQSWRNGSHNYCLPAYVVDANKRIVNVETSHGQIVGRSIIKLTHIVTGDGGQKPAILIEPIYTTSEVAQLYQAALRVVFEKARRIGAVVLIRQDIEVETGSDHKKTVQLLPREAERAGFSIEKETAQVFMPPSYNQHEYSDSLGGVISYFGNYRPYELYILSSQP